MSSTTSGKPETSAKTSIVNSIKALVGLSLDQTDTLILKYLGFFGEHIPFQSTGLLHVVAAATKPMWSLRAVYPEKPTGLSEEKKAEVQAALEQAATKLPPQLTRHNLAYYVRQGTVLEEFVMLSNEQESNLIVVGRRSGSQHGILSKNLIRQSGRNLLVVPEKAHGHLKTIVVPMDFSANSIRALRAALDLKHHLGKGVHVIAINVYQRPSLMAHSLDMTPDQFERSIRDNHEQGFAKFMAEEFPGHEQEVKPLLIDTELPDVAHQILEKSLETKADLLVMGSKGTSRLERLLLGSTTETLLDLNDHIPTMIIR
jgi:nucleotide-binding universal stress UspA family protein